MTRLLHKYITRLLPVAVIVSLLVSPIAAPALAHPGLSVSGAILVTDVSPGETVTHTMTVSISPGDPATDITVEVGGMAQSLNGAFQMLEAALDTSSYSARQFITVDKASFHLEPGMSQDLTVTVHIPQDIGAGGRYAIISIMETSSTDKEGVTTLTGVDVPVAITVRNTPLTHQGKITELTAEVVSGQPLDIFTTFKNTGNHHFRVKGEVTVSNSQGEVLDTISMPLTTSSIIPNMSRRLQATFIPQGELPPGVYSIKAEVTLEDGTSIDQGESSFEVKEPYTPPSQSETSTPAEATEQTTVVTAEESSPEQAPTGESEQSSATPSESSSFPILPVAGIAAGTIIIITLIVVIARRFQY